MTCEFCLGAFPYLIFGFILLLFLVSIQSLMLTKALKRKENDPVCTHLHYLKNGEDVITTVRIWKNSEYKLCIFKSLLHKACLERDTFYRPEDASFLYYKVFNETLPDAVFSPILAP